MKVLKFSLCCLVWTVFVIIAKAQSLDTSIYYQLIERQLDVPKALAQVIIKNKEGEILVRSKSMRFDLESGTQIQAQNTKTVLYLYRDGQVDSIGHHKVDFVYDIAKKTLFLEIPSKGNQANFYSNSLHKVAIRAQKIEWKIEEEQLYFDNKETAICFTSVHHFEAPLMEAYQSLGNTNPLVKMALYVQKKGSLEAWFDLNELTLLLDKRLEKVVFMDSIEIKKARRNPAFKIIRNKQDFEQFRKGYPAVFKFAGMHIDDLKKVITDTAIDEKIALPLYLRMVKDGFLDYNKNTQQIQLQDKLFHYVASMNRKSDYDYDYLQFCSTSGGHKSTNFRANLDLKTQILTVPNVKQIILGKLQEVLGRPSGALRLLPNRNLRFDGQIWLGNTYFEGLDIQFEYKTYRVLLPQINRLSLAIYKRKRLKNEWDLKQTSIGRERALNKDGKPTKKIEFIQSVIEEGKGYLRIDTTTNKSGKNKGVKKTPFFVSDSKSRVYYDKRRVNGQVAYPRKSFYYELNPFQLNQVNVLDIKQLSFKGKFYSFEVLPTFNNELKLQFYDLSLGFDTLITKAQKIPIYLRDNTEGKGSFYGQLQLSNAGLLGNGTLTYLGASLGCDVFDFLPEELNARQVDSFQLEASKNNPKVKAKHIKMSWKPYENQMHLSSLFTEGFPFYFYYKDQKYRLDGQLMWSPKGLFGKGTLDWKQASMVSNPQGDYEMNARTIRSASVAVLLKIRGRDQFAFEQENVRLELDFEAQVAHFSSKDTNTMATFPYNAYQTTLDQFEWNWKDKFLFMKSRNGQKGVFRRDNFPVKGLYFEASKGGYDLNTGVLILGELAPVKVGNALLYLKDSVLEIEADGCIQRLKGDLVIKDSLLNPMYSLHGLDLVWNVKTNSFVSKGTSFELKKSDASVFKLVKGKIEVLSSKEGLIVQYVWVFPNGDWWFLKWEKGVLSGISNDGVIDGVLLGKLEDFEAFRGRWL